MCLCSQANTRQLFQNAITDLRSKGRREVTVLLLGEHQHCRLGHTLNIRAPPIAHLHTAQGWLDDLALSLRCREEWRRQELHSKLAAQRASVCSDAISAGHWPPGDGCAQRPGVPAQDHRHARPRRWRHDQRAGGPLGIVCGRPFSCTPCRKHPQGICCGPDTTSGRHVLKHGRFARGHCVTGTCAGPAADSGRGGAHAGGRGAVSGPPGLLPCGARRPLGVCLVVLRVLCCVALCHCVWPDCEVCPDFQVHVHAVASCASRSYDYPSCVMTAMGRCPGFDKRMPSQAMEAITRVLGPDVWQHTVLGLTRSQMTSPPPGTTYGEFAHPIMPG